MVHGSYRSVSNHQLLNDDGLRSMLHISTVGRHTGDLSDRTANLIIL